MITRVNALGSDHPEQLILTDRRGHPICDVEVPGVDPSDADHIKIPGVDTSDIDVDNIDIPGVDVKILESQVIEIVDPEIPLTDPEPIETAPVHQVIAAVDPMPAMKQVEPELCRSSRVRTQTEKYNPIMSGSKYSYAVT